MKTAVDVNVKQAIPFLWVTDMEASLRFYRDGVGFAMANQWNDQGVLRWCSLTLGNTRIMLQEFWKSGEHSNRPEGRLGQGVSIVFECEDAIQLYHEFLSRGIKATKPFVGNAMWVTSLEDPDGYRLDFESYTDVAEETVYEG